MKLDKLTAKSAEAARVRAYQTHPDVVALRVEQVRGWSGGLIWAGVVLGLAFTATNVQAFAAAGAAPGSLPWLAAWLLDPMVSLVLVGVLLAEQVTSRWQLDTPVWARRTKWFALAATYVMNTWQPWASGSAAQIVLHSVPPLLVFTAVEGGPAMREKLTEAVTRALTATTPAATNPVANAAIDVHGTGHGAVQEATPAGVHGDVHEPTREPVHEPTPRPVQQPRPRRAVAAHKTGSRKGKRGTGRVLFADYLAMARDRLPGDGAPVTPTWCREVTGCSAGTSVRLAAELNTTTPPARQPAPDTATGPVADRFTNPTDTDAAIDTESEAA